MSSMLEELHTQPMKIHSRDNYWPCQWNDQTVVPVATHGVQKGDARGRQQLGQQRGVQEKRETENARADEEQAPAEEQLRRSTGLAR